METNRTVLGIVGSPNPEGRTNQLIMAALKGAAHTGLTTELLQLSEYTVEACKDCLPFICKDNLKCSYDDEAFEYLSQRVLNCDALVLGTPVYWWDTSGLVKYFILKMFRVYARSAPLQGLPAFGIAIAGGSGNGLVSGLRPVYHFFQTMQIRAVEPVPATRFNFDQALKRAGRLGGLIAGMTGERATFSSLEERLVWYDNLPYLGLSRAGERRLLADLLAIEVAQDMSRDVVTGLARSDALAAAGRNVESLSEIARVYEAGLEIFERKEEAERQP